MDFSCGDKVKFADGSHPDEEFEVVSWDDSRNHGRIEDVDGRGWYVFGSQLKRVETENDEEPSDFNWDDEDEEE